MRAKQNVTLDTPRWEVFYWHLRQRTIQLFVCNVFGHSWKVVSGAATYGLPRQRHWGLTYRCSRCRGITDWSVVLQNETIIGPLVIDGVGVFVSNVYIIPGEAV